MDCLGVLMKVPHYLDVYVISHYVEAIMNIVDYISIESPLEDYFYLKQKIPKSKAESSDYFLLYRLLPTLTNFHINNSYHKRVVDITRQVFSKANHLLPTIIEAFEMTMTQTITQSTLRLTCVVLMGILPIDSPEVSSFFVRVLFSPLYPVLFPVYNDIVSPFIEALRNLMLVLVFFGCCKVPGLLILVFRTLRRVFAESGYRNLIYFFPLFRSCLLVDSDVSFIPTLLESGIFSTLVRIGESGCPADLLDELADFLVVMVNTRPAESLAEQSVAVLVRNLTFLPRYQSQLLPFFKIGMLISGDGEIYKTALTNTMEQALIILTSCLNDPEQRKSAVIIVSYVSECVKKFGTTALSEWIGLGLFEIIASLPNAIQTVESILVSVSFFTAVCGSFPQFLTIF
jgi:hypothetical protein